MDFELDETQRLVRDTARDYATKTLAPLARKIEAEECVPQEVLRALGGLGLLAVNVPEALGGNARRDPSAARGAVRRGPRSTRAPGAHRPARRPRTAR